MLTASQFLNNIHETINKEKRNSCNENPHTQYKV